MSAKQEEKGGNVMCSIGQKKKRLHQNKESYIHRGDGDRGRGRGRGSGRGKGRLHEVRGGRGRGVSKGQRVKKRRTRNHSTFFLQLLSIMVCGKGEKRKCNEWAKVGPGRRTSRLNTADDQSSPPAAKGKQARQPSESREEVRRTTDRQTDSTWWWAEWQRVRASMNQHIHPVS